MALLPSSQNSGNVTLTGAHTHSLGEKAMARHSHAEDWWSAWNNSLTPLGRIAVRLNLNPYEANPFEFIQAHRVSSEKVFVFVVQGGEPVVLEDGPLFPSDGLITQLRLLLTDGVTR